MTKLAIVFAIASLIFFGVSVHSYLENLDRRIAQEERV